MLIKVAIVEDELEDQETLKGILEQWSRERTEGNCEIVKDCYSTGEEFLEHLARYQLKYHLIFMDIQLDGVLSGLLTAKKLRESGNKTPLVFLTGHDIHIREGYQVRAMDYLSKPANTREVYACLERLPQVYSEAGYIISDNKGTIEIPYQDILYFSQAKHYMEITTKEKMYKQRILIKDLEKILPAQFVRCNRGSMINIFEVRQIHKRAVLMNDGRSIPITATYVEKVHQQYMSRKLIKY